MTCPQCDGAGQLIALSRRIGDVNSRIVFDCDLCNATGSISEEKAAWAKEGETLRQSRINRNETLREFAKRTGIDVGAASKAERGCINPDIIKV